MDAGRRSPRRRSIAKICRIAQHAATPFGVALPDPGRFIARPSARRRSPAVPGHHQTDARDCRSVDLVEQTLAGVVERRCTRAIMRRFARPPSTDGGFAHQRIDRFRHRPGHGMNASPLFGHGGGVGARANDRQGLPFDAIIGSSENRRDPIGRRVRGPTHFFRFSSGEFGE